jgi:hypothetical protein
MILKRNNEKKRLVCWLKRKFDWKEFTENVYISANSFLKRCFIGVLLHFRKSTYPPV